MEKRTISMIKKNKIKKNSGDITFTDELNKPKKQHIKKKLLQETCDSETIIKNNKQLTKIDSQQEFDEKNKTIINKNNELTQKNNEVTQRLIAVEKILEFLPFLKKDRNQIIDVVLDKKIGKSNEKVLEKINYKGKFYYKDKNGNIINDKLDIVGLFSLEKNSISYYFFDEFQKIKQKLPYYLKKIEKYK